MKSQQSLSSEDHEFNGVQRIEVLDCMTIHPEFLQLACLLIETKSNPSVLILKKLLFHVFPKPIILSSVFQK